MHSNDFNTFASEWVTANELSANGVVPSQSVINKVFDMLSAYTLSDVVMALSIHGQKNKFKPTPNDIIEILNANANKHIDKNEAWALCVRLASEDDTAIITGQMRDSWAIASEVYFLGDKIGSRMAFIEAYERLTVNSTDINWEVQLGSNKSLRHERVKEAVSLGRIGKKYLELNPPESESIGLEGLAIKALAYSSPDKRKELKEKWGKIGGMLNVKNFYEKDEERAADRLVAENHKSDVLKRAVELMTESEKREFLSA